MNNTPKTTTVGKIPKIGKLEVGEMTGEFERTVGYKIDPITEQMTPIKSFDNPAVAPDGFEWKGQPGSMPGSKNGNYYNIKTGESLRPDLSHPMPIGPHWDYRDSTGKWWRIFKDGRIIPK